MANKSLSIQVQEITRSGSHLFSTFSNISDDTKLGISVTVLLAIAGAFYKLYTDHQKQQKKLSKLFNLTWKNISSINKDEVIGNRPFEEYYYTRPEDEQVRNCLKNEKSVLIVGPPLAGKTRMVYEALKKSNKRYDLIIPRSTDIDIESFILPKQLKVWKSKLMFIDDLHRFAEQQNFEYLFEVCRKNKINLIATCRSEIEYKKTKKKILENNLNLETELFDEIVVINEILEEQGKEIAEKVDRDWNEIKFNKTVGSIFMPLSEMSKRFEECTSEEKTILRAVKKLYICGVYEEDQIFQLDQIKRVSENEGVKKEKFQWIELISKLSGKEFIKIEENKKNEIWVEDTYLEDIVELNNPELHAFEEIISTFTEIPEVLFKTGNRAYEVGSVKLQKANYMKITIKAYQKTLKIVTMEKFPIQYAMTQNNMGNAHRTLAEVEDKVQNSKRAIEAYQNTLRIRTVEKFPIQYATTQNNIGAAYVTLAEVEDKAQNSKKAIEACQNALKITTVEKFPTDYAMTLNNMGNAYKTLAEVEDKAQNSKKAIEACQNALKITTIEKFPIQYAMRTYARLAII
ncbi:MAG: tetratricopeptide repeat protein [Bacteroidales bacterium]|nr:tetratricopeptide repeat protein [Bacteroidales bacterium]